MTAEAVEGRPADCVYPHLRAVLYLPVGTDALLEGFDARLKERLSEVLAITPGVVQNVVLQDAPVPASIAEIYMPVVTLGALKTRLADEAAGADGILIAGVRVLNVASQIVADGARDECDAAPCGAGQHCRDASFTAAGDYICSCIGGGGELVYPNTGGASPSCSLGTNAAADALEVLALCNGHTLALSYSNALLHATACNAPALDPPPALHPTRLVVSGSALAGGAVANTALFMGTLLLQHLCATVLGYATKLPEPVVREAMGHPHIPIRMFVLLLPGAVYCSIGLVGSGDGPWAVVLGSATLCFWCLCGSLGVFTTPLELTSCALGQHVWVDGRWRRTATFRREYLTAMAVVLLVLATNMPHRVNQAEGCMAQRVLAAIVMFFHGLIACVLQPYMFRAVNVFLVALILLQSLGYLLIGLGLLDGGHAGHEYVDSAGTLRLVTAVFLLLFMVVSAVYRVQRADRVPSGEVVPHRSSPHASSSPYREGRARVLPLSHNPLPAFLAFLRGEDLPDKAVYAVAAGDAAWMCLALAVAAHWAFLIGALLCVAAYWYVVHVHLLPHHPEHHAWSLSCDMQHPPPTLYTQGLHSPGPAEGQTPVVRAGGDAYDSSFRRADGGRVDYSPPKLHDVERDTSLFSHTSRRGPGMHAALHRRDRGSAGASASGLCEKPHPHAAAADYSYNDGSAYLPQGRPPPSPQVSNVKGARGAVHPGGPGGSLDEKLSSVGAPAGHASPPNGPQLLPPPRRHSADDITASHRRGSATPHKHVHSSSFDGAPPQRAPPATPQDAPPWQAAALTPSPYPLQGVDWRHNEGFNSSESDA